MLKLELPELPEKIVARVQKHEEEILTRLRDTDELTKPQLEATFVRTKLAQLELAVEALKQESETARTIREHQRRVRT